MPLVSRLGGGTVAFSASENASDVVTVAVSGVCIPGMEDGLHGFHVHEGGDVVTAGCMGTGSHYDTGGSHHGGPRTAERHTGDLGNVVSRGGCLMDGVVATMRGVFLEDLRGRSVVVHAKEDDMGRGGTEESLRTGTAGARIACARIEDHAFSDGVSFKSLPNMTPAAWLDAHSPVSRDF